MKNENISFDELKQYYDDLSDNYSILQEKYGAEMKRNSELCSKLNQATNQYDAVVQQNKSLQTELNQKNNKIKELESKPFFPYQMNDGGRADFGEFFLISHAWFTISNFPAQLGIVEVEWKSLNQRKMYLGVGISGGKDFVKDVLSVALHGQKIKE